MTSQQISRIELVELRDLEVLNCSNNNIKELKLPWDRGSGYDWIYTSLKILDCSGNEIKNLDLSRNTLLETLDCSKNIIENINLPKDYDPAGPPFYLARLNNLNCSNNLLSTISFLNNYSIKIIDCSFNNCASLEFASPFNDSYGGRYLQSISYLDCSNNQLAELNVADPKITELDCSNNLISNFSSYGRIRTTLNIANNQLKNLNLKINEYGFGNTSIVSNLDTRGNSELYCVTVENKQYADNNPNYQKGDVTGFKEYSCYSSSLYLSSNKESIKNDGWVVGTGLGFYDEKSYIPLFSNERISPSKKLMFTFDIGYKF